MEEIEISTQPQPNQIWKMFFNGAYTKDRAGARVVLIPPEGERITISHKLQFEATNNIVEYEALILGLEVAKKLGMKCISAFGDSELVVQQVRQQYQCKHSRMKSYRNYVWDIVDNFFYAFNITTIPRDESSEADALETADNTFKAPPMLKIKHEVEIRHRPSIPDNVKHWQVFEDDQKIKRFLKSIEEFSPTHINQDRMPSAEEEEEEENNENVECPFEEKIVGRKILQLKSNFIPRGLVPLEQLFDHNDIPTRPTAQPKEEKVQEHNLGTPSDPQMISLLKDLPKEQKHIYIELFREFKDVFTWKYEDFTTKLERFCDEAGAKFGHTLVSLAKNRIILFHHFMLVGLATTHESSPV